MTGLVVSGHAALNLSKVPHHKLVGDPDHVKPRKKGTQGTRQKVPAMKQRPKPMKPRPKPMKPRQKVPAMKPIRTGPALDLSQKGVRRYPQGRACPSSFSNFQPAPALALATNMSESPAGGQGPQHKCLNCPVAYPLVHMLQYYWSTSHLPVICCRRRLGLQLLRCIIM